jgi:FAD-dependent urate hydroxylase
MSSRVQVAIIGAGPYGLSLAAHLGAAGVHSRVFGAPMEFWSRFMPAGMLLRSEKVASNLADPHKQLTLDRYLEHRGVTCSSGRVPVQSFNAYGRWFHKQAVRDSDSRNVSRLQATSGGFHLTLEDGEPLEAERVVVAAGIASFAYRPPQFNDLPREVVSHSSEHSHLQEFAGRRVLVIGAGQSAFESAALLREAGAEVEILLRARQVRWLRRAGLDRHLNNAVKFMFPTHGVGRRSTAHIIARPGLYRLLPPNLRTRIDRNAMRPAVSGWVESRISGMQISTGRSVAHAERSAHGVSVRFDDGSERQVNHILLGTGYRVDISRYNFISPELLQKIRRVNGYPELNAHCESSVPGLFFVGATCAYSFGPLLRFVVGSQFCAGVVTEAVAASCTARATRRTVRALWPAT